MQCIITSPFSVFISRLHKFSSVLAYPPLPSPLDFKLLAPSSWVKPETDCRPQHLLDIYPANVNSEVLVTFLLLQLWSGVSVPIPQTYKYPISTSIPGSDGRPNSETVPASDYTFRNLYTISDINVNATMNLLAYVHGYVYVYGCEYKYERSRDQGFVGEWDVYSPSLGTSRNWGPGMYQGCAPYNSIMVNADIQYDLKIF